MHAAAIKKLQDTIDETIRTMEKYDTFSFDYPVLKAQIKGLKYAISLLKG